MGDGFVRPINHEPSTINHRRRSSVVVRRPWGAMRGIFLKLVGLGTPSGEQLAGGRLFFVRAWPLWLAVLAIVAIGVWVVFFYRREGSRVRAVSRLGLVTLRVAAFLVLLGVLFQPMVA